MAACVLFIGCESLQNAVANGDTRTISFRHLHTGETLTTTYKVNGRYDEDALKKINWVMRDWRRNEATRMDPHVIDVVWEVYREVGGKDPIEIICGYRAPQTNSMLRRRSSGVAKFSQHTLGKAIDLHIPGISLELQREAALRLQRGGVGYYPSSGSPFVHLDVGNVRHWPRIAPEHMARIMRKGPIMVAAKAEKPQRNILASLFGGGQDDEEDRAPAPTKSAQVSRPVPTVVAAVAAKPEPKRAAPVAIEKSSAPVARVSAPAPAPRPVVTAQVESLFDVRGYWGPSVDEGPAKPQERIKTASAGDLILARETPDRRPDAGDRTASLGSWPARSMANDRVPPEVALAYAAQADAPVARDVARTSPMGSLVDRARVAAESQAPADAGSLTVLKKTAARLPSGPAPARLAPEPIRAASAPAPVVTPGMRFDDPWLRAVVLAPSLQTSMTATQFGDPDYGELRMLMLKPVTTVVMTFSQDPHHGMEAEHFSGGAVVFLSTVTFIGRTAALR